MMMSARCGCSTFGRYHDHYCKNAPRIIAHPRYGWNDSNNLSRHGNTPNCFQFWHQHNLYQHSQAAGSPLHSSVTQYPPGQPQSQLPPQTTQKPIRPWIWHPRVVWWKCESRPARYRKFVYGVNLRGAAGDGITNQRASISRCSGGMPD